MPKIKSLKYIVSIFLLICPPLLADGILDGIKSVSEESYTFRLVNGDIISGPVVEFVSDPELGDGVKVQTELGKALIFENQIIEVIRTDEYNRHNHRIYLLPTAVPIGGNFFIGNFELLFFYAGVGIGDWLSLTAGRSIIPGLASYEQISSIGAKASIFRMTFTEGAKELNIAVGGNLAYINDRNRLIHIYIVGTIDLGRTSITANIFNKQGSDSFYTVYARDNLLNFIYENGAFGVGFGIDTKLTNWKGVHFIGEILNANIKKPSNSGVLLGFRLSNTMLSADFGLAFFTSPFAVPFVSFAWTPF